MGLERLAVVVQDVDSIFDVDTICALRNLVCEISGKEYEKNYNDDVSIRLITDHIRSATFMISDGIMPVSYTHLKVDGYIFVQTGELLMTGDFAKVRVTGALEYDLIGELADEYTE